MIMLRKLYDKRFGLSWLVKQGQPASGRLAVLGQRSHAWLVWLITLLFTLLQFISQLTTGVMADAFTHTFDLNFLTLGVLAASFYLTYVPMQGPIGMLMDRYGPRILLSVGALIFALGSFVLAKAPGLSVAVLGRMLMGFGASGAFIGCINTGSRWFPRHFVTGLTSLLEFTGMAAVLLGDQYLPLGLAAFGWRKIMLFNAVIALVLAGLVWLVVRNASPYEVKKEKKPCHSHNIIRRMGWRRCLFAITRRTSMWINGFYCGVMFSFVSVFSALWGIPYLQHVKGISLLLASHVDNFLLFGVLLGCIVMIFIQKRIKDDLKAMRNIAMIMGGISFSVLFYASMPIWMIELSLFLLGVLSPFYLLSFKVCALLLPDSLRASSTGFTNMMTMAVAPIFQLFFAGLVMVAAHYMQYFHAEQIGMALFPVLIFTAGFLVKKIKIPKNRPVR
jgi:MFS family permease